MKIKVKREGQIVVSQITQRMKNYEKYLGKRVEIVRDYNVPLCEEKCLCDSNTIIKDIKILE